MLDFEGRCYPLLSPTGHLAIRDFDRKNIVNSVDVNDVTILDEGNRASNLCLRHNMSDHEAMRADLSEVLPGRLPPAEATVRQTCHVEAETRTHNQARWFEHFRHA